MALPEFDRNGNLPPGIHEVEWAEFAQRFGRTPERQNLLERLHSALDLLQSLGCRQVWIGGSFVTDAERVMGRSPKDVDVCWSMEGVDLTRLATVAPELHPLTTDRHIQQRRFGGDYIGVSGSVIFGVVAQFQRDRHSRHRGIVLLMLTKGVGT